MKKGICHVSQIPVRGKPQSSSEMVTQLLFGETYTILKDEKDWCYIKMDFDGYEGWLSKSSIFINSAYSSARNIQVSLMSEPINDLYPQPLCSSMGSEIIGTDHERYKTSVVEIARQFLGAPYLWGGRHFSGIDCSGFVQIVFKCLNLSLPRDASMQQKKGKPIAFDHRFEGDLVFFESDGKVTHVGIVVEGSQVIHAHGMVRLDTLTKEGIINAETGEQSHSYHSIKRMR